MGEKKLLFSLTKKDFEFQTFRSGGKGGQNQNKVESGVRCIHIASGARGECRETRDQLTNKRRAFERCVKTEVFQKWHKIEVAKRLGHLKDVDRLVDEAMKPENLRVEYFK